MSLVCCGQQLGSSTQVLFWSAAVTLLTLTLAIFTVPFSKQKQSFKSGIFNVKNDFQKDIGHRQGRTNLRVYLGTC